MVVAALVLAAGGTQAGVIGRMMVETPAWRVGPMAMERAAVTAPPTGVVVTKVPPTRPRQIWHVVAQAPPGGNGSVKRPFDTIQKGLEAAYAGDVLLVHNGTYRTPFTTLRAGRPDAPIRILGGGAQLIGNEQGRLVQILHSYVTLQHFSIAHADQLVWVQGATGVKLLDNVIAHAASECVRIKFFSHHNEVAGNRISGCGERDFNLVRNHKNGEGIYIGTAPEQLYKNPVHTSDDSGNNWVHDNVITTPAECVDIKEGAGQNLVNRNLCLGSKDPNGAGFSSRGKATIFVDNTSTGNAGAGIRLGGDAVSDGILSVVLDNRLVGNRGYGVKVMRQPQGRICGNRVDRNSRGNTNGTADPAKPC